MCVGSDIIASITARPTIKAVILYVETFKTDVNVHFGNVMCLTLADIFQYYSQSVDIVNIPH
jgi:hypothetical protein